MSWKNQLRNDMKTPSSNGLGVFIFIAQAAVPGAGNQVKFIAPSSK